MIQLGEKLSVRLSDIQNKEVEKLIDKSEKLFLREIHFIADAIIKYRKKFVLIAGPSSSGKSTTAHLLLDKLKEGGHSVVTFSLDDFYKTIDDIKTLPNGKKDLEAVDSIDIPFFISTLSDILEGKEIFVPKYNFQKGLREFSSEKVLFNKDAIFIIEGLHGLNPAITVDIMSGKNIKVYVNVQSSYKDKDGNELFNCDHLRLARRLVRDYYHRGMNFEKTFSIWQEVIDGELRYIRPFKGRADYRINSLHLYEPMILKPYLEKIIKDMDDNENARKMLRKYKNIKGLDADFVPKTSLLQEFLPKE